VILLGSLQGFLGFESDNHVSMRDQQNTSTLLFVFCILNTTLG